MLARSVVHLKWQLAALFLGGLPVLLGSIQGCGSELADDTGSAELVATTAQELTTGDVTRVTVTITGQGVATPITRDLVRVNGQWRGTASAIPAGAGRNFHIEAFNGTGAAVYRGDVPSVSISKGSTSFVSLLMQQEQVPNAFRSAGPRIDWTTGSSNAVAPGESVSLAAMAHNPDGDALTVSWSATGGTFTSATSLSSQWSAPVELGWYELRMQARGAHGAVAATTFTVQVVPAGNGSADVSTTLNTWPDVSLVTASPTRIDVGETTALRVIASDADGDPLQYAWSASCVGSFDNSASRTPKFKIAAPLPPGNACALVATVSDGRGGTNSGTITITTGPPVRLNLAPVIDTTFQSRASASPGASIVLGVNAHDPEGTALTVSWATTGGTLGAPATSGGSSEIVWTAPTSASVNAVVTATVTDATGAVTLVPFSVMTTPPAVTATIPVGGGPYPIAANPVTNKVYVGNTGTGASTGTVTVIDGATNTTSTVTAGRGPQWVAINKLTNQIYVANYGTSASPDTSVTQVDGATNAATTISVASNPFAIDINETTNRIYVTQAGLAGHTLSVIDGATGAVTSVSVASQPENIKLNATTNKIYVGHVNGSITVLNGATNATTNLAGGARIGGIAVNPVTNKVYFSRASSGIVTVMDGATNARTDLSVGGAPQSLQVNTTTNKIYVSNSSGASGRVIDGATNSVSAIPLGGPSSYLAILPSMNRVYVTNSTNTATILDVAAGTTLTLAVGSSPTSLAVNPSTNRVYVVNKADSTVSVIE